MGGTEEVFLVVGEDGGGRMRPVRPAETLREFIREDIAREDAYWGQGHNADDAVDLLSETRTRHGEMSRQLREDIPDFATLERSDEVIWHDVEVLEVLGFEDGEPAYWMRARIPAGKRAIVDGYLLSASVIRDGAPVAPRPTDAEVKLTMEALKREEQG